MTKFQFSAKKKKGDLMVPWYYHEAFIIMMIVWMLANKIRLFNDYEVHDDDDNDEDDDDDDDENIIQTLCSQLGLWKCQCLQRPSTMQCLITVVMMMMMMILIMMMMTMTILKVGTRQQQKYSRKNYFVKFFQLNFFASMVVMTKWFANFHAHLEMMMMTMIMMMFMRYLL